MKKTLLPLIGCMLWTIMSVAAPRTAQQAEEIAGRFAASKNQPVVQRMQKAQVSSSSKVDAMRLVYTQLQMNENPALYVFNREGSDGGFVIVSADDNARTILGYSDSETFTEEDMPSNLRFWLQMYADEIAYSQHQPVREQKAMNAAAEDSYPVISPLLGNIQWGQNAPYNNLCPTKDGERCVTGCVATAASQIMYYHKYPTTGTGSSSYDWEGQILSADYGNTTYDWANMLPDYSGRYTTTQATAVATLMSHVGISCEMLYDISANGGSGATDEYMMAALTKYFGYDKGMRRLYKDFMKEEDMLALIAQDLQAGRPIYISGQTTSKEGHAFVLDGMNSNGYVHINWGWDGYADSYFAISALNPYGQGTGGAASGLGFTEWVTAYTGIQPNVGGNAIPQIMADSVRYISAPRIAKNADLSFSISGFGNIGITNAQGNVVYILYKDNAVYTTMTLDLYDFDLGVSYYYVDPIEVSLPLSSLAAGEYEISVGVTTDNGATSYPILTRDNFGEHRFPITVTNDSVFLRTDNADAEKSYTIRVHLANDTIMDVSQGVYLCYNYMTSPEEVHQGIVQMQAEGNNWWLGSVTVESDSIQCYVVNRNVIEDGWENAQSSYNQTPYLYGDCCLLLETREMYISDDWQQVLWLWVGDCEAFTDKYTPYNLMASAALGNAKFVWNSQAGTIYRVLILSENDENPYTFYSEENELILNYSGVGIFNWAVQTLSESGYALSEYVWGNPLEMTDNPYEPKNLQATTQDSITYSFTWDGVLQADSFRVAVYKATGAVWGVYTATTPFVEVTFTASGDYSWTVNAYDATGNAVGYASGEDFRVPLVPTYAIESVQTSYNGVNAIVSWETNAPCCLVELFNQSYDRALYDLVSDKYYQFPQLVDGTYYLRLTPVNAEQTFLIGEDYVTILVINGSSSVSNYRIRIQASVGGTVTPEIDNNLPEGTIVDITATPNENYRFLKWSDGVSDNPRSLVLSRDTTITAMFEPVVTYLLTIMTADGGRTNMEVGTYSCYAGEKVTLFAIPAENYQFDHWIVNDGTVANNPTDNPLIVEMTGALSVTPVFVAKENPVVYVTLTIQESVGGSVVVTPMLDRYILGSNVILEAKPEEGYNFDRWNDGVTTVLRTVVLNTDTTLMAVFKEKSTDISAVNDDVTICVRERCIEVHTSAVADEIGVVNVMGQCIAIVRNTATAYIRVPQSGVYIVRCGQTIKKVMVP